MARKILTQPSRTLMEYRLLPGLTTFETLTEKVSLRTPLVHCGNSGGFLHMDIPLCSAAMQAVSGIEMAKALVRVGGAAFIFCSQGVKEQADMVREVVKYKAEYMKHNSVNAPISAAINTRDYAERVEALVSAGVEVLCLDSSDGHSVFQAETLAWIRKEYPNIPVVAGNVVTGMGFRYLADNGASAVKVGMGSGSICITQEQKGTGRGLASAIIDVVEERDAYSRETGKYIPIIADGGIVQIKDATVALALGADSVMLGRFFARFNESPTEVTHVNGKLMKPYWGEGSERSRAWREKRYSQSLFVEGVEGFVDCIGSIDEILPSELCKMRSSMATCGCATVEALHRDSYVEPVSELAMREGKVHSIYVPEYREDLEEVK